MAVDYCAAYASYCREANPSLRYHWAAECRLAKSFLVRVLTKFPLIDQRP